MAVHPRLEGSKARPRPALFGRCASLGLLPLLLSCGDDPQGPPRISLIVMTPTDTLVAPGDTVRVSATPIGLAGTPVDVSLQFTIDDSRVGSVDSTGLFVAIAEGSAVVTAMESGGVVGNAELRVAAVSQVQPNHTAFGGLVTARGAGFGQSSVIRFGDAAGRVRTVASDGRTLEAWVPWDAKSGDVSLTLQDGRVVAAPDPFFLTGSGDDALEPNDHGMPRNVAVPFENPYLVTRLTDLDRYRLTLFAPTPLSVRIVDKNDLNTWPLRLVAQLNWASGEEEIVGVVPGYAFERNERQDAVIARASLGPGTFDLRVFVAPGQNVVDRRYEISIDTVADYQIPPDPAEPDDVPAEAPSITTPYEGRFALENPWAADYYALDVVERSRVFVAASAGRGIGVFFVDGDRSVTWQFTNGFRSDTYRGALGPFGEHSFNCTVEPGRYYVGVLDNSGSAGPYVLSVDAEPTALTFLNCATPRLGSDLDAGLRTIGVPF